MKTKCHRKKVRQGERHYTVILEPDEGGYHAFCPALPGCHTWGATLEKATRNVREAIEVYCESLVEDGEPLPEEDFIIRPMVVRVA
jgi:predicted RNase H-like HicB family nuclease